MFSDPAIDFGQEICAAKGMTAEGGKKASSTQMKENAEQPDRAKKERKEEKQTQ